MIGTWCIWHVRLQQTSLIPSFEYENPSFKMNREHSLIGSLKIERYLQLSYLTNYLMFIGINMIILGDIKFCTTFYRCYNYETHYINIWFLVILRTKPTCLLFATFSKHWDCCITNIIWLPGDNCALTIDHIYIYEWKEKVAKLIW